MVGEEKDMCKHDFGLTTDLRTTLRGIDFASWLHDEMAKAMCGGQTGAGYASCLMTVPTLNAADVLRYRQQLDGTSGVENNGDADVFDDPTDNPDMTETNEALFDRAGTPLTTRQNALDIIAAGEANDELTPYERSAMLWEWCADSRMGQTGCFHSFQRFVHDPSIDRDTIRQIIDQNGHAKGGSHDDDDANGGGSHGTSHDNGTTNDSDDNGY
jgi:hypothetical protein